MMTKPVRNRVPIAMIGRRAARLLAVAAGLAVIAAGCGSTASPTPDADAPAVTSEVLAPTETTNERGALDTATTSKTRPANTTAATGDRLNFEAVARTFGIDNEVPRPHAPVYGFEDLRNAYTTDGASGEIRNNFVMTLTMHRNGMSQQDLFDELVGQVPTACGTRTNRTVHALPNAVAAVWSDTGSGAECRLATNETSADPRLLVYRFERVSYPIAGRSLSSISGEALHIWQRAFPVPVTATSLLVAIDRSKEPEAHLSAIEISVQWTIDGTVDAVLQQLRSVADPNLVLDATSTEANRTILPFHDTAATATYDLTGRVELGVADNGDGVAGSTIIRQVGSQ
jgi:hypothetical protein